MFETSLAVFWEVSRGEIKENKKGKAEESYTETSRIIRKTLLLVYSGMRITPQYFHYVKRGKLRSTRSRRSKRMVINGSRGLVYRYVYVYLDACTYMYLYIHTLELAYRFKAIA